MTNSYDQYPQEESVTHEVKPGDEQGGPENDQSLPPADSIPGNLTPEESDAAPLPEGDD